MTTRSATTSAPRHLATYGSLAGARTTASRCIPRLRNRRAWYWRSRPRTLRLVPPRKLFHQLVQVFLPRKERLNIDPLILAVRAHVEDIAGKSAMSVRGNTCVAQ